MKIRDEVQSEAALFALEKKELETVLASGIFAVSSNAAKLLRFVCERYFQNAADSLTEYDVAIQALGRRPDFDPQRDSIVRVEAHRVRKRLQEYYESEGAAHPVKIVLSRGHYAPRFIVEPEVAAAPPAAVSRRPRRTWTGWLVAAALVAVLAAGLIWLRSSNRLAPVRAPEPAMIAAGNSVRILAGLESGEHLDRSGARWSADAFYSSGTFTAVRYYSLALADDPAIY